MQLICISRGSYNYGKDVAVRLAAKMGYVCVSREEITDSASDYGIPVGKIEIEVLKNRPIGEELAIQIDLFKAFVTAQLCERVLQEPGTVYHGRTGHLVLPGISHVLRVRTIADADYRVSMAANRMNLSREKARHYIEQVDDDIRRWVRILYNENWEDPALYDVTLNAAHLSADNAAAALIPFPALPEFQATPSSRQAMKDALLASRCRLAIGRNERTRSVKAAVRAERGNVLVTYLPRQAQPAQAIPEILGTIEGVASILCTVATTNILFIGERFDPDAEDFGHLIEISEKWNAAIELVRLNAGEEEGLSDGGPAQAAATAAPPVAQGYNGGILDDDEKANPAAPVQDDLSKAVHRLVQAGRAGGCRSVKGDAGRLAASISGKENYSLVVVGDVFTSKARAQQRLKRDLVSVLSEKFRVPVIGTEELKTRYLFGPEELMRLIGCALLCAVLYGLVWGFEEPVLNFISAGGGEAGTVSRLGAALAVVVFTPLAALAVGGLFSGLLKLIKLE